MIARVAAIVRADVLIRFRRLSTLLAFLALSALAFVWVPPPATGRALIRIGDARAVYNSAAVSIGTAMLAALFIGLAGFYVVSNAIARDVRSRCGSVLAATAIRSSDYLIGKFAGNLLFLTIFTAGFMIVSMAMVIVRGEAPLEPFLFLSQYLLIVPPTIVLVSALAIVFESIPFLSGRSGDVAYFFLYLMLMSVPAGMSAAGNSAAGYFDLQGFAFVLQHLREAHHTTSLSVGSGPFDPKLVPFELSAVAWTAPRVVGRSVATALPLVILPLALLAFHRFDPARVKSRASHSGHGWIARANALLKPVTRLSAIARPIGPVSADALMTFGAHPIAVVALVALMVASAVAPASLPIAFAAAAVFVADVATRDRAAGASALTFAAPRLRERFVAWKFASSLVVAATLLAVPAARALADRPSASIAMLTAIVFVAAAATALGVITTNPKAFIAGFLSFWYLVVSDRGATPSLDFGAFFTTPPASVPMTYGAIALLLLATAEVVHRLRLRS